MKSTWQYFEWKAVELQTLQRILDSILLEGYANFLDELSRVDSYDPDDRNYTRQWAETLKSNVDTWCSHFRISPTVIRNFSAMQRDQFSHRWSLELNTEGVAEDIISEVKQHTADKVVYRPRCLEVANSDIMSWLSCHPEDIDRVHHRTFEAIVAEAIRSEGWKVELTKRTRDGGYDIMCIKNDDLGLPLTMIVETKLYNLSHSVGLPMVDRLMGVAYRERVKKAILVTNSRFTSPAWRAWEENVGRDLELVDRDELLEWLSTYEVKASVP